MSDALRSTKGRYKQLADAIKEARISAKLSQQELANKLEVSAGAVGQWEIGRTSLRQKT